MRDYSQFLHRCTEDHSYINKRTHCFCSSLVKSLECKCCLENITYNNFARHLDTPKDSKLHVRVAKIQPGYFLELPHNDYTVQELLNKIPFEDLKFPSCNPYLNNIKNNKMNLGDKSLCFSNSKSILQVEYNKDTTQFISITQLLWNGGCHKQMNLHVSDEMVEQIIRSEIQAIVPSSCAYQFQKGSYPGICHFQANEEHHRAFITYGTTDFYERVKQLQMEQYFEVLLENGICSESCLQGPTALPYNNTIPVALKQPLKVENISFWKDALCKLLDELPRAPVNTIANYKYQQLK